MTERQQLSYILRKSDSATTAALATSKTGSCLVKRREVFANGTVCSGWWKKSDVDDAVFISDGFGAQVRGFWRDVLLSDIVCLLLQSSCTNLIMLLRTQPLRIDTIPHMRSFV